jgi:hypothetical protein
MKRLIIFATNGLFLLLIVLCTSDKKVDTTAIKKEIESRKIKKVTEAEIVAEVMELGNLVASSTRKTLSSELKQALAVGGVENAISYCNLNAMPLVDSLSDAYGADIRRVSLKTRNPADDPSELERELLEAYQYQWKDSISLKANVQQIDGERYLFTEAILVDNALCLTCHGKPDNGMLQETSDFIKTKYPEDQATGYALGDLRGMWSITFSKKKVIQQM